MFLEEEVLLCDSRLCILIKPLSLPLYENLSDASESQKVSEQAYSEKWA